METRHDLRRKDRLPCEHRVTVLWRDIGGQDKCFLAKTLDICELGLRIEMPEALRKQTSLTIGAPKLGLAGNASVRHCARIGAAKFAVGVEFAGGMRWAPKD